MTLSFYQSSKKFVYKRTVTTMTTYRICIVKKEMDYLQNPVMLSKFLNDSIFIYKSVRKPGFVHKFNKKSGSIYRCCRCRELGKDRNITVVDGSVKGRMHPEDGHHPDCEPLPEAAVVALQVDRSMRKEVGASSW